MPVPIVYNLSYSGPNYLHTIIHPYHLTLTTNTSFVQQLRAIAYLRPVCPDLNINTNRPQSFVRYIADPNMLNPDTV